MPCCAGLLVLFLGPRVALAALALFSGYLEPAFGGHSLVLLLGWLFLPWTTLAYAWAIHANGEISGFSAIVVILALLMDLGVIGGAARRPPGRT
jgi:hypothetical protein